MRYSKFFGKTVKSVPSDLKAKSHILLYKGGFVRQISAGRYSLLPLGFRVWQKIMDIIEEEMIKVDSQRVLTPTLHPISIWKTTNRDVAFGDEMHIVEDHHGATFAMGATAEGVMVEMVKMFKPTYKNLPIHIHQFSGKFRDEKRPKEGLIRVREFVMKDAYSFNKSAADSKKSYKMFYDSYLKIAKRLDLNVIPVLAESGAIGGDYNHEFIVQTDAGEGKALVCSKCKYAAHVDRAESDFKKYKQDKASKKVGKHIDTTVTTCEVLAEKMGIPLHVTTKTILFQSGKRFIAAMVRGDYDINEIKLKRYLKVDTLELASAEDIRKLTGSEVGFMGPIGLPKEVEVVGDLTCKDRINFEVGGNETGIHLFNINYKRDFPLPEFADIRMAKEGDKCSNCRGGVLKQIHGIEWGHCFNLDTVYSKPHKGNYIDKGGKEQPMWMGSYGIGLGRSIATIVETHNDKDGIMWPKEVAPFDAHLITLTGSKGEYKTYEKLMENNIDVLWDDRDVGAGEKFADADLIGIPVRLVLSGKTKAKIEYKERGKKETQLLTLDQVINKLEK